MNERNVDALEALLDGGVLRGYAAGRESCQDVARFLASHGVLVPAALTEDECEAALSWCDGQEPHADWLPVALGRIAKGEPA